MPAQRDLAYRLGLSVATVARVYAEAERRGWIFSHVGRGTFVRAPDARERQFFGRRAAESGLIDLSLNFPPSSGHTEAITDALESLCKSPQIGRLIDYLPHKGLQAHREIAAAWIERSGHKLPAERIVICHGAQHGMAIVLGTIAREGDTVLTERLTYAGIKAIATYHRLRLHGVATDDEGLIPAALEEACTSTGARILYALPTVQNPTATTMSIARREAVAEVIARHNLLLVEGDVFRFLAPDAPPPIASLLPESALYVTSVSKFMAPGLRIGFVAAPATHVDGLVAAVRATAWMATPLMAEVAARCIADGTAERLAQSRREEALARREIADRILGRNIAGAHPASYHVWLRLPTHWTSEEFARSARVRGVAVTPAAAVSAGEEAEIKGVRVCLGAAQDRQELEIGLSILAELLGREHAS